MHAPVGLLFGINQYTTFKVPSFTGSKDMIRGQILCAGRIYQVLALG